MNLLAVTKKRFNSNSLNIALSFVSRAGGAATGFIIIPFVIQAIGKEEFGLYLSIVSFFFILQVFDFGLNNILKNELSGYIVNNKIAKASSLYTNSVIAIAILFVILLLIISYIRIWDSEIINKIFNLGPNQSKWTNYFYIIATIALVNYLAQPGINLYYSLGKTYLAYFVNFIGQFLGLVLFIMVNNKVDDKILLTILLIYGFPAILNFVSVLALQFSKKNKIKFKVKAYNKNLILNTLRKSSKFFIIQIASVTQFQLGNFMVSLYFKPEFVTEYNTYSKYFSVSQILLTIISTPYWINFAKLNAVNDYLGLEKELVKFRKLVFGISAILVLEYLVGPFVFNIWLGRNVTYNYNTSLFIMLYYITFINGAVYVIFNNSISLLKIQTISSIASVAIFVILFDQLAQTYGIISISIALIASNFYGIIIAPIQAIKYLNSKDINAISLIEH
ncbi:hypothetical protein GCM10028803_56490 [Larkinella knui]|uniref:Polysaccharide biosynthesis protein n=1 Tax=Larkinella knui TaxID=2025310 RepID=A0A3P1CI18_9BACT|nr:oligosaccharide flippase family protein [Larkinella knui]RRB12900.1 hypothetical protein EHT87_22290 [Larkinella knui]